MFYYKLQVCCLIILIYIAIVFSKGKRNHSMNERIFVLLLKCSFLNLILDIITVYTVYAFKIVPPSINRIFHMLFYSSIIIVFYLVFLYILTLVEKKQKIVGKKFLLWSPVILITAMCGQPLYYIEASKGNYSYGPAYTVLFLGMSFYVILQLTFLFRFRNAINGRKRELIVIALGLEISVSIYQGIFPYIFVSGFGVTFLCLVFFMITENPDLLLAEKLEIEKQNAERANIAKSMFLANMSHEIRTPINGVLGMNEMILRESNEAQIREYAGKIKSSAHILLGIINDILDLSKIEAGKMELCPTEYAFNTLLYDVYCMIENKAAIKSLNLQFHVDEEIPNILFGDDVRIRQVLINLISNAVKYTEKGSVNLSVTCSGADAETVLHFKIQDTGIGIKKEDMDRLFQKFERLEEKRNRSIEGTGIGLSLTQQLLALMDSKLIVESEYGVGSVFSFDITQKVISSSTVGNFNQWLKTNYNSSSNIYQPTFFAPGIKILVVDDNKMNRLVFSSLLKESGTQIYEAENGMECLNYIKNEYFDIIFLDHMMPDMDGMETFARMQEMTENLCKNTPVIAFTANAMSGSYEIYKQTGFAGMLTKPVIPEQLDKLLAEQLSQNAATQENEPVLNKLPDIDGMDWNYAMLHLPNTTLVNKMVQNFYAEIDTIAHNIESLSKDIKSTEGIKNYQTKIHGLKSSCAMIGALPLASLAKILESASAQNQKERVEVLTPILLEELRLYKEKLSIFSAKQNPKKEMPDNTCILALFQMLQNAIRESDLDAIDTIMEKFSEYEYDNITSTRIINLQKLIRELQFDEAANNLEIWINHA